VPVTKLAKWKTVVQMVAIGFLLAGSAGDKIWPYTTLFGLTLLWIAAIFNDGRSKPSPSMSTHTTMREARVSTAFMVAARRLGDSAL